MFSLHFLGTKHGRSIYHLYISEKSLSITESTQIPSIKNILTLKECNNNHVRLDLQLDIDIYIGIYVKKIAKLYYDIEVKNITQLKSISFSATRNRSKDVHFLISLDRIPGNSTDDFGVNVTVYKKDDQLHLLTTAHLPGYQKLLRHSGTTISFYYCDEICFRQ